METDLELLNAARRMKEDALVKIFDLYAAPLYNYALRLCGDPLLADDIVGDVFDKLLHQLSGGQGPKTNLRSYLYQIAYHRIVDESRTSPRSVSLETLAFVRLDAHAGVANLEDQILYKRILEAIRNDLTDDQRHVIILRFLEGFNLRETAAILGKSVNHVKVIQTRAMAKLRRASPYNETGSAMPIPKIDDQPRTPGPGISG